VPFKPLSLSIFEKYIAAVEWKLEKGKIDWNLYNEKGEFVCSIIKAHGKNTKSEITAFSVNKAKKSFEKRGLTWPPNLKLKKK
jgi:hypothetical protein